MPFPSFVARVNRRVTNPLVRRFAGRSGALGIVVHRGRRSGREFRTPVLVHRHGTAVLIALTYGDGADWVRNVLAAGSCDLVVGGETLALGEPEVVDRRAVRDDLAAWTRVPLRILGVDRVLRLRPA